LLSQNRRQAKIQLTGVRGLFPPMLGDPLSDRRARFLDDLAFHPIGDSFAEEHAEFAKRLP
jgi:hypothetical protein